MTDLNVDSRALELADKWEKKLGIKLNTQTKAQLQTDLTEALIQQDEITRVAYATAMLLQKFNIETL